jgi:hypothetical protein
VHKIQYATSVMEKTRWVSRFSCVHNVNRDLNLPVNPLGKACFV